MLSFIGPKYSSAGARSAIVSFFGLAAAGFAAAFAVGLAVAAAAGVLAKSVGAPAKKEAAPNTKTSPKTRFTLL
jgi:hypothetical protein